MHDKLPQKVMCKGLSDQFFLNGSPYATGPLSCLSVCPACPFCRYNVGVLWPSGWMDQDVA